ncbi:hypothetical protein ACTIVE_5959 [Actinomadura verrucosospora]|uniref:Uncharacterized protein n=1 Tax=Actinomadura verrucosospora TaxID=46165 RepID=A0A7D3W1T4_ACTVE|nr:hypothetical protein ACTIVE_5959 [Actinomadura verrucosospora]
MLMVSKLALATGVYGSPYLGYTVWADIDLRADAKGDPTREVSMVS